MSGTDDLKDSVVASVTASLGASQAPGLSASAELVPARRELPQLIRLMVLFAVYFGFRSGCLMVLPLASKRLLQPELGVEHSPLYQLPMALWFVMDLLLCAPNARYMGRYGRRAGFLVGCGGAFIASVGAFATLRFCTNEVWAFALLCLCVCVMSLLGMAEFVRFAAAEVCSDAERRATTVSRVITAGAVLAMAGPFSASFAADLAENPLHGYGYFFLFLALLALVGTAAAWGLDSPPVSGGGAQGATSDVLRRKPVWTAIVAQVCVQFTMVTPMSAAPLALTGLAHLEESDLRLSACMVCHVLAMFLPGLGTGSLIAKVGLLPVICLGLALQAAACALGWWAALADQALPLLYACMVLLGVGWNLSFVGGTVLLLKSHSADERTEVTAVNETLRFAANAVAVLLSSSLAFETVNAVCLGFTACMFVFLARAPSDK